MPQASIHGFKGKIYLVKHLESGVLIAAPVDGDGPCPLPPDIYFPLKTLYIDTDFDGDPNGAEIEALKLEKLNKFAEIGIIDEKIESKEKEQGQ